MELTADVLSVVASWGGVTISSTMGAVCTAWRAALAATRDLPVAVVAADVPLVMATRAKHVVLDIAEDGRRPGEALCATYEHLRCLCEAGAAPQSLWFRLPATAAPAPAMGQLLHLLRHGARPQLRALSLRFKDLQLPTELAVAFTNVFQELRALRHLSLRVAANTEGSLAPWVSSVLRAAWWGTRWTTVRLDYGTTSHEDVSRLIQTFVLLRTHWRRGTSSLVAHGAPRRWAVRTISASGCACRACPCRRR